MNGYVTFVNDNERYLKLTDILVESVISFSDYDIEVFSINCQYNHSSNRVHNKIINLNRVDYETICYSKLYSTYNSMFDKGVQLDADMILTPETDLLFKDCDKIKKTPLGSIHPVDVDNMHNVMNFLGVTKKTQHYVHATYLFANSCKDFFKECFDVSNTLMNNGIRPINYDETIYNVMLWKYGSTDYVKCYDPYFEVFVDNSTKDIHGYGHMDINYYICHGEKNYLNALNILELIKKRYSDKK